MSDSVQPHRRHPTRLPRPWDSPGKNTGVGCHFLLQCMKVISESEVAQSCPTLSDPMDCSPPSMGFSRQEYWSGVPLPSPPSITGDTQLLCHTGLMLSSFSPPTLWDPMDCNSPRSSVYGDSPGKNTGVGCHFLLQCMKVKSEREVSQSCPTLRDPMDCSLPGSSIHGIFQARVLEWDAIAFSHIYIYMYICVCVCVCVYVYIYIHIHTYICIYGV